MTVAQEAGFVSTGIPQLDEFLGGGLPPGSLVVLLAPTGAGSEILAKQFSAGVALDGDARALFVSTEESVDDVAGTIKAFGLPGTPEIVSISDKYSRQLVDEERAAFKGEDPNSVKDLIDTDSKDLIEPSRAPSVEFLRELIKPYATGPPPKRYTINTVDFFISLYGPNRVFTTVTALKMENARAGGVLLVVLTKGAHDATVERRIEMVADCLIELESHRRGSQFEKYLLVKKVKNRFLGMGVAPYTITNSGFELDNLDRIL